MSGREKLPDSNEIFEMLFTVGKVLLLRDQRKNYLRKGGFLIILLTNAFG